MEKEKLELISVITNELNARKIPYITKVVKVGSNNVWYDFFVKFDFQGQEQTLIFSTYVDETDHKRNGIVINGNILNNTPVKGAISKLRFCEFLNTLKDLLDSIRDSERIANNIIDYMYNKDKNLSIYHIGDV